ncbi:uncharacterized protein LOC120253638 [Dioscorea cayenensis subsp. rotundata]|uniref:Uncharacterized protein LOC120253638 n=1 Tax=Dioscorea cayennensis subsp. rotundata TaxID=55577 RepID=A0AB40AS18_DIOCR|nr:uncharacterized protein LOC120253638 [Dioscorea cayenensis subsp. rotundata]
MDEEGRLKNVFWADARSIAAYEAFGDVISFDTTYLTNKYDMPFAPFVGVNHHGQTVSDILKGKEGAFRKQVNVKDIPSRYILPRWRKDIKRMHTYVQNCYDDPQTSEEKLRFTKLCSHFSKAAELGAESNDKFNLLMKYVDDAIEKLMDNTTCKENFTPTLSEATIVPHQQFLTPLKMRSKGRPPSKRKKSKKAQTKEDESAKKFVQDDHCTQESVVNSNSISINLDKHHSSSVGFTSQCNDL